MGLKFKSDTIYEFDVEENGLDEIYQEKACMANFATSVYKDRHIIMTGGILSSINLAKN